MESGGTLAFHLTCCSSGYTKSFIAISHSNECTNVNAELVGYAHKARIEALCLESVNVLVERRRD